MVNLISLIYKEFRAARKNSQTDRKFVRKHTIHDKGKVTEKIFHKAE